MVGAGQGRTPRVLVVDDDEHICALVEMTLARAGYEVEYAFDGQAALGIVAERPVDAIVLDYQMPQMNGIDFARAYRALPGPHAPIVVTSAVYDIRRFASATQAADALPKPFSPRVLLDVITRAVGS
jgi:CheY-like chemotaxis protein